MASQNAIDFFATVGRKAEPLKCTTFPLSLNEDDPPLTAREVWEEAITDVVLLGNGDSVPDPNSWILVDTTIGGEPLDHPIIAFRKRKFSGRPDHITKITFLAPGESIPNGFELLRNTMSGKGSGYIAPCGYIAIQRATIKPDAKLVGESLILDINAVKKSSLDEIPEKYVAIDREHGNANPYATNDIIFIIQPVTAIGLCNVGYEASLLDRIPTKDYKHLSLPEDALPAFMFPHGLRLELCDRNQYPLPSFFTFVFTDQDGKHLYVACLKFYEDVPKEDLMAGFRQLWGDDEDFTIPEGKGIFCPKLICVLSRVPFYRAMRRYLRQLYSISLSSSICPLEHFIGAVVGQVPIPVEGGRPFQLVLDAALISSTSRPMASITFDVPSERFFPIMDLDFAGPLRCFSVDVLLCVYALMLREAKIVFVSHSNALLTETMETLRMLLFPLQWASCFVSRLPPTLIGLLQAPGGFMVGIHLDDSLVGKQIHTAQGPEISKKYIQSMHLQYPLLKGTYVIDLVSNSIHQFNGKYVEPCTNLESIAKSLPSAPKLRLRARLLKITDDFRIGPQLDELEEIDSAFDFQSQSMSDYPPRDWTKFPTLTVRDAFMSFMADLLGDYTAFIIPPVEDLSADTYRTFREEFMVEEYMNHADVHCRPVLELLMETQMFSVLLQSRSEGTSQSLVFFEEASRLQQQLGLGLTASSLMHNGHGGTTVVTVNGQHANRHGPAGGHGVSELPYPLYKLLECEYRWSCLSKTMQQQTLQRASAAGAAHGGATASSSSASSATGHSAAASSSSSAAKPLQLTYVATSSSISPLRTMGSGQPQSHGITYSHHPTQNQKLQDLLQFIQFAHLDETKDAAAMTSWAYAIARRELDRDENLQLHVASLGPLILPGPTLDHRMEAPSASSVSSPRRDHSPVVRGDATTTTTVPGGDDEEEENNRPVYCYSKGWPTLDPALVTTVDDFIHRRIKDLRQERLFMLSKVNPTVKLLVRNPTERLFSDINSSHQHHQQQQLAASSPYSLSMLASSAVSSAQAAASSASSLSSSSSSSSSLAPKNHVSMSMMSAVLTTMSTVITTMSLRVKNGHRPLADMLQILGMLAVIDCWGLSDHISETTWRTVLVACAAAGGDSMRRISALVFKTMQQSGLVPNALTYGQYIKAIGAKREAKTAVDAAALAIDDVGREVDGFYYMEEIGFSWYSYKVQESFSMGGGGGHPRSEALPPTTTPTKGSSSGSGSGSGSGKASSSSTSTSSRSRRRREVPKAVIASLLVHDRYVHDLEDTLKLKRAGGTVVFFRPKSAAGYGHPQDIALLGGAGVLEAMAIAAQHTHTNGHEATMTMTTTTAVSKHAAWPRVYDYLQKRSKKIYDLAQRLQRRHSHLSTKSRQSSFTMATARSTTSSATSTALASHGLQLHHVSSSPGDGGAHRGGSMFSQVTQDLSRSPMNLISKMGGGFFHRDATAAAANAAASGSSTAASGKSSPVPPPQAATGRATGAISSFLSKGSSLFQAMKSSTHTSQVTTPIPSAAVSPVRPPTAPMTTAPNAPSGNRGGSGGSGGSGGGSGGGGAPDPKRLSIEKMQLIATLAAEERFDDDLNDSQLDDSRLDAPSSASQRRSSASSASSSSVSSASQASPRADASPAPPPAAAAPHDVDLLTDDVRGILLNEETAAKTPHKSAYSRDSQLSPLPEQEDEDDRVHQDHVAADDALHSHRDDDADADDHDEHSADVDAEEAAEEEEDETWTLDKVQEQILSSLQAATMERRVGLGVRCACVCDCGISMMFEEIMARWCHGNSIDVHRPANARLSVSKTSFNADMGILCTHCQKSLSPTLCVTQYEATVDVTTATAAGAAADAAAAAAAAALPTLQRGWDEEVTMMSPFVMQFEYEELLLKVGELAQNGYWLHEHHPAIYWNLLWYSGRFHVPSGLSFPTPTASPTASTAAVTPTTPSASTTTTTTTTTLLPSPSEKRAAAAMAVSKDFFYRSQHRRITADERLRDLPSPLVLGWLPSVVEKKMQRLLQGLPGDYLDIKDLFPACSEAEFRILSDMVVSNLDGSPDGLRTAMIHFTACPSLFPTGPATGGASASSSASASSKVHRDGREEGDAENGDGDRDDDDDGERDETAAATTATTRTSEADIVKARIVYTRLLILGVHFAHMPVYDATKTGLLRDYSKDINFDKIFLDAIKCVMSPVDFQSMGIGEAALMSCTTNHTANTVRAMIGVLP